MKPNQNTRSRRAERLRDDGLRAGLWKGSALGESGSPAVPLGAMFALSTRARPAPPPNLPGAQYPTPCRHAHALPWGSPHLTKPLFRCHLSSRASPGHCLQGSKAPYVSAINSLCLSAISIVGWKLCKTGSVATALSALLDTKSVLSQ